MKGVSKDVAQYLNYFQFGIAVLCGLKAILPTANKVFRKRYEDGSLEMLTVNFSNAFNMVD